MEGVRAPFTPAVPWLSRFPEINVRTYVRDAQGRSGIWFLSLDAARLPAVLAARAGYRLPYFWSDMATRVTDHRIEYRCRRRSPSEPERNELAHFLTARFRLFTVVAGRLAAAEAEHPTWPLHHAELRHLNQNLIQTAGLRAPTGAPLIHASPGVPVRIGRWRWARRCAAGPACRPGRSSSTSRRCSSGSLL
jgi:uncharacterized protein YqjF (DUF2071 family)